MISSPGQIFIDLGRHWLLDECYATGAAMKSTAALWWFAA
jgi:hypothetical protein